MTRRIALPALAILAAVALAACGSDDKKSSDSSSSAPAKQAATPPSSSGGAGALKLSADPNGKLAFVEKKLTAKAGKVTLDMTNPSSAGIPHGIAVEGNGVDKDGKTAQPGSDSTVSASLKPGKYTFYCPVDGHKAAGMKGTLTVN